MKYFFRFINKGIIPGIWFIIKFSVFCLTTLIGNILILIWDFSTDRCAWASKWIHWEDERLDFYETRDFRKPNIGELIFYGGFLVLLYLVFGWGNDENGIDYFKNK